MKINVTKVVKPLILSEYADGFGVNPETGEDVPLWVWVNPPGDVLSQHDDVQNEVTQGMAEKLVELQERAKAAHEAAGKDGPAPTIDIPDDLYFQAFTEKERQAHDLQLREWYALIWSQGPAESHMSAEEIKDLNESVFDTDPGFPQWMQNRTLEMIREHRVGRKKA